MEWGPPKYRTLVSIAISTALISVAFAIEYYLKDAHQNVSTLLAYPLILVAIVYGQAKYSIVFSAIIFQMSVLSRWSLQYDFPTDLLSLVVFLLLNFIVLKISRRGEEKVKELNEKLAEEIKHKMNFVNSLGQLLKGSTQLIKASSLYIKGHPTDTEKFKKSCDILFEKSDAIDKAIYDLNTVLDLAQDHKLDYPLAQASVRTITNQIVSDILEVYKNKIVLTINGDGKSSQINEDALKRAIKTLVLSAIKFGKEHEQVMISYDEDSTSTTIKIHTDSSTVDEHELKALFSAFLCLQGKSSGADLRWGMNLSIALGIIEAHSGKISVISNKDEGLNFTILLPQK